MNIEDAFPKILPLINDCKDDPDILMGILPNESDRDDCDQMENTIDFIRNLVKNPYYKPKETIGKISKFIRHTKLIETIANALAKEKKQSISTLCLSCAKLLKFQELQQGQILFRYQDIGDKCYFIIDGKLSCLKPTDIHHVKMYSEQYLRYLLYLKKENELAIVEEVMKKNEKQFPITTINDLSLLRELVFIATIKAAMRRERFCLEEMEYIFKKYERTYQEFKINEVKLNDLITNKNQRVYNADVLLDHYLNKKFKMTTPEMVFFDRFQFILQETEMKEWTCVQYVANVYFGTGFFFGDSAFEKKDKNRNASIRAETDAILASLNENSYMELISARRQKEKAKKVGFLFENFFFKTITQSIFEKHYFEKFNLHEYFSQHVLYQSGKEPKEIIFLHQGKVAITIKCSVIDLHNLIKFLIDKMASMQCFTQGTSKCPPILSKEKISELKHYLHDPILSKMKSKATSFINEMNKMRELNLFILSDKEVIGIEEIILQIPYLTFAKVFTGKALFFKLKKEDLQHILIEEKTVVYPYSKLAANKLLSLLERLYHIKKNYVDSALHKLKLEESEKEELRKAREGKNASFVEGCKLPKSTQYPIKEKLRIVQMKNAESKLGNLFLNLSHDSSPKKNLIIWNPNNYFNHHNSDSHKILRLKHDPNSLLLNKSIVNGNITRSNNNYSFEDQNKKAKPETKKRLLSMDHKHDNLSSNNIVHSRAQSSFKKEKGNPSNKEIIPFNTTTKEKDNTKDIDKDKEGNHTMRPLEANDLARTNSQLSYVDLFVKGSHYNSKMNYHHKNTNLSERTNTAKFKMSSSIDSDRITYLGNFRKNLSNAKESDRDNRINSTNNKKSIQDINLCIKSHHQKCGSDIISQIVKEYYTKMQPSSIPVLGKSSFIDASTSPYREKKKDQISSRKKFLQSKKSYLSFQDNNI